MCPRCDVEYKFDHDIIQDINAHFDDMQIEEPLVSNRQKETLQLSGRSLPAEMEANVVQANGMPGGLNLPDI